MPRVKRGTVRAAKRKKLLEQDVDVYIINHDGVKAIQKEVAEREDIDVVVKIGRAHV